METRDGRQSRTLLCLQTVARTRNMSVATSASRQVVDLLVVVDVGQD
jgi:hypothetical protein